MEAHCPDVLVLRLPAEVETIPRFLDAVWAFDASARTSEGSDRTELYRQNAERERLRAGSIGFDDFLARLELNVTFTAADDGHSARVAQLTQRTNQFNTTTVRRTEGELEALRRSGELECVVVSVTDRFGDYGVVGVMMFRASASASALELAAMLLSCRALGRGVEHRMLARLGDIALERGLSRVDVRYLETPKNGPARVFLQAAGGRLARGVGQADTFEIPATIAAAAANGRIGSAGVPDAVERERASPEEAVAPRSKGATELWRRVASHLYDSRRVLDAIAAAAKRPRDELVRDVSLVAPRTPVEETLAGIWAEILRVDRVGAEDSFFELGGDSLRLTQVMARVRAEYGVDVPFQAVFETPTVAGMSVAVAAAQAAGHDDGLADLLDELESYSAEETSALLADAAHSQRARSPIVSGERRAPDRGRDSTAITTLAMITHERVDALDRALQSYVANTKAHGRAVDFVVMDDSTDPRTRAAYRERLRSIAKRFGIHISYAGLEEKRRFATTLAERTGVPLATASFALLGGIGDDVRWSTRAGANRNALLLHSAGELVLSVDDDTECVPMVGPRPPGPPRLAVGHDPADCWFFADAAEARRFAKPVDVDVLHAHEGLLGRTIRAEDFLRTDAAAPWPNACDASVLERVDSGRAKVLATYSGVVGDCGWGSPFGYWGAPLGSLVLENESHARFVQTAAQYSAASTSRILMRVADSPCISDTYTISAFVGLDNRDLLPPFVPVQRGQDLVFSRMLWRCFESSCFGHLPVALLHSPVERRRFSSAEITRSASGYDTAKLVIDCVLSCALQQGGGDGRSRLRSLGAHMLSLGSMPLADFDACLRAQTTRTADGFVAWLEAHLGARGNAPAYWADDVRRYIAAVREATAREDYCVPLDLLSGRAPAEARTSAQRIVREVGGLLSAWPEMVEAARELRIEGSALAQPV